MAPLEHLPQIYGARQTYFLHTNREHLQRLLHRTYDAHQTYFPNTVDRSLEPSALVRPMSPTPPASFTKLNP